MSPQAIILVPSYVLGLFLAKKLPNFRNQGFHVFLQFLLVSPWIYHTKIIDQTSSVPTHSKLFESLLTPLFEYTNYLGGWGLTREWGKYLDYGTIGSEENIFWNPLLLVTTIILVFIVSWISILTIKIRFEKKQLYLWQEMLLFLSIINLSTFYFVFLRIWRHRTIINFYH